MQAIKKVLMAVEMGAKENTSVLITERPVRERDGGRAIHNLSPRKVRSMIRVNCAAYLRAL
jgi:transcriptional regulator with GAF, ATPase, and Fis domain